MFIDEKGKLFGKINVIDLVIIVVIVAVVGILGYRFLGPASNVMGGDNGGQTATVKFYIEEASDFVADKVKVGDKCSDESRNINLGTVTNVEIGDAVSIGTNAEGQLVKTSKPDHKSMIITAEVPATEFEHGAVIGGVKYYVGHSFTLLAGKAKLWLRVYDISFGE